MIFSKGISLITLLPTLRLRLVRVKVFPENILFSGKENVFMCLVTFQKMFRKIFSDVWLCSSKYHRKHIFYLLLTFSRLPNEYIISFIPQNINKTQKKIIKSGHFAQLRLQSKLHVIGLVPVISADDFGGRFRWTISAILEIEALDDLGELGFGRSLLSLLSFSLSLFLSLSLSFSFARDPEMV